MRHLRREAIDVLTQLVAQAGAVEIIHVRQHYAVCVRERWYDAGTVEQALTQAGHAELNRATGTSAEVQPPVAPPHTRAA